MLAEVRSAAPYAGLSEDLFRDVLSYIESGGYSLKAYDRFRRLRRDADGTWRVSHPKFIQQHRMNAGIIVDAPLLDVRFRNGRKLGTVEEYFASTLSAGDTFYFAGLTLEVERIDGIDLFVKATTRPARIPTYVGARMAMTTNLADRVRAYLHDREQWPRFPDAVRELAGGAGPALRPSPPRPAAGRDLPARAPPLHGRLQLRRLERAPVARHADHAADGKRRAETARLRLNDYALACYGLEPIDDPAALFSPISWPTSSSNGCRVQTC
jgi:ATP-dependent Lhr-like helicase